MIENIVKLNTVRTIMQNKLKYRKDLKRPLTSGEVDANFEFLAQAVSGAQFGIKDMVLPNAPAPSESGQYPVKQAGVYTGFKDSNGQAISVTADDFKVGIVYIIYNGTYSYKFIAPIPLDGEVAEGDMRGVSGSEVFVKVVSKSDLIKKGGDQYFKENNLIGYINGVTGVFTISPGNKTTAIIPIELGTEFIEIIDWRVNSKVLRFLDINSKSLKPINKDGESLPDYYVSSLNGIIRIPQGATHYQLNLVLNNVGDEDNLSILINGNKEDKLIVGSISENPEKDFYVSGKQVSSETLLKKVYLEEKKSKNLLDKSKIEYGKYVVSTKGTIRETHNSAISPIIPLIGGCLYAVSGKDMSSPGSALVCYDGNGKFLKPLDKDGFEFDTYNIGDGNNMFKAPDTAVSCVFTISFQKGENIYDDTVMIEQGLAVTKYEPYYVKSQIKPQYLPSFETINDNNCKEVSLENVDLMVLTGASHAEVNGCFKDKGFISYISAFLDYNFENYSQSGRTHITTYNSILSDADRYGFKLSDFSNGGHIIIALGGNEAAYYTTIDGSFFKDNLLHLISAVKAHSLKPILMSHYGGYKNPFYTIVKDVAEELGLLFIDLENEGDKYWNPIFRPFWFSGHTGTRTEAIKYSNFLNVFNFKRPERACKIYRSVDNLPLNELYYLDNFDKLKKFKELSLGHKKIKEEYHHYYDRLDKTAYTDANGKTITLPIHESVISEYNTLRRGGNITSTTPILIKYVIEDVVSSVNDVIFKAEIKGGHKVYVRSFKGADLSISTSGQTAMFTLDSGQNKPLINSVLVDSNNPNTTFKVIDIDGDVITTNPSNNQWETLGNMTGTLSSNGTNYTYNALVIGVGSSYYNTAKKPKGKWIEITYNDNVKGYPILESIASNYDELEILIVPDGNNIVLGKPKLSYYSNGILAEKSNKPKFVSDSNEFKKELINVGNTGFNTLSSNLFFSLENNSGTSEVYDGYVNYNSPNGVATKASVVPVFYSGSKILRLKNNDSLKFSTPIGGKIGIGNKIEFMIVARHNPEFNIENNTSVKTITEESFDFSEFEIVMKKGNFKYTKTLYASLWWSEIKTDFNVNYQEGDYEFEIVSKDDKFEIIYAGISV